MMSRCRGRGCSLYQRRSIDNAICQYEGVLLARSCGLGNAGAADATRTRRERKCKRAPGECHQCGEACDSAAHTPVRSSPSPFLRLASGTQPMTWPTYTFELPGHPVPCLKPLMIPRMLSLHRWLSFSTPSHRLSPLLSSGLPQLSQNFAGLQRYLYGRRRGRIAGCFSLRGGLYAWYLSWA